MVKTIAVVGAGQMGSGIAQQSAVSGHSVILNDIEERFVQAGLATIKKSLGKFVEKGKMSQNDMDAALQRIRPTTNLLDCAKADLVVEAVVEKADVKKQIFQKLDAAAGPATILASNTSSIPITELASVTKRPDRFIGMHFMNPVPIMQLVEVIRGHETSDATTKTVMDLSRKMGKTPVEVRDFPAFATNRILLPMINEAFYALMEGVASARDIDTCAKLGLNHPMGPLELADFVGLDTCLYVMEVMHQGFGDSKYRPCPLLRKYVQSGRLGKKVGKGVYDYAPAK
ncbi:MAG: 3-hydroxybutyryl-CoA dehydrogenase [Euryarchaeota archaeon]|nr:3-hydroxybutyryl-CoA dehydrogenase [Euryarchaeota archaeon]